MGPRGPHLFRSSSSSTYSAEYAQDVLTLSPITPKAPYPSENGYRYTAAHEPLPRARTSPFQFTHEKLNAGDLAMWSPEQVAQWMLNAGIEMSVAEKFVENDINGAILITLKFEDLRELDIQSFGIRTKIWDQIHGLRENETKAASSPRPDTPIEDEECKEVRRERRRNEKADRAENGEAEQSHGVKRSASRKQSASSSSNHNRKSPSHDDIISPLESVSIVGIEQMMPKPHHCKRGESCSKFRRQQRMIEAFKQDHPFVDMDKGGVIMVAGNPGNPETAQALNRPSSTEALRPMSDAVPSVVASSDVLGGGGVPPLQYLQEAMLRNVESRDPQDNVRQFLDFQRANPQDSETSEVPPTPPFELYPTPASQQQQPPHEGLRALPKLSIPSGQQQQAPAQRLSWQQQQRLSHAPQHIQQQQQQQSFAPYRMERADPRSPDLQQAPYRFGTPFSDMDVPVTMTSAAQLGPVARDASQSVPPDMNYRMGTPSSLARSASRASRRPSFQVMAPLEENNILPPVGGRTTPKPSDFITVTGNPPTSPPRASMKTPTPGARASTRGQPLQAPPRPLYPWSSSSSSTTATTAAPATPASAAGGANAATPSAKMMIKMGGPGAAALTQDAEGVTYQGAVRKRRTRMLRHEWHEQYATLRGTRLALHSDRAAARSRRTLEYIDVDDYAIACSSVSSGGKLNAAFKAMQIARGGGHKRGASDDNVAAFNFQLIPQQPDGGRFGARLRKRESGNSAAVGSGPLTGPLDGSFEGAVNGTGKTHHFAVKSRDERIDWMRELMLAKALKQKGEGFEVNVNGNMI